MSTMTTLFSIIPPELIQELSYLIPFKKLKSICDEVIQFGKVCQTPYYWQQRANFRFDMSEDEYRQRHIEANYFVDDKYRNPPDDYLRTVTKQSSFKKYPEEGSESNVVDLPFSSSRLRYDSGMFDLALAAISDGDFELYKYFLNKHIPGFSYMDVMRNRKVLVSMQINQVLDAVTKSKYATPEMIDKILALHNIKELDPKYIKIRAIVENDIDKYKKLTPDQGSGIDLEYDYISAISYGSDKIGNYILDNIDVNQYLKIRYLSFVNAGAKSLILIKKLIRKLIDGNINTEKINYKLLKYAHYLSDKSYISAGELLMSFPNLVKLFDKDIEGHSRFVLLIAYAPSINAARELYHVLDNIGIKITFEDFQKIFDESVDNLLYVRGRGLGLDIKAIPYFLHQNSKLYRYAQDLFSSEIDLSKLDLSSFGGPEPKVKYHPLEGSKHRRSFDRLVRGEYI